MQGLKREKDYSEINRRIAEGNVRVLTASEMKQLVQEVGPEQSVYEVDVVTTGTFGAMCSSGVWMNFGHSEPPMKMSRVWLNDVEAYKGVAAVDAYLGATQPSEVYGIEYGGGHVIEDLVRGRPVHLRAEAYGTDCYPRRDLSVEIRLEDLNQATMSNPRNCYQRYGAATNSTGRTLYTYMGKLLPHMGNVTFSGAGELSPLMNDPSLRTIGIGTRILLGGGVGYVVGNGTQHSPDTGFSTLMVQGDLRGMSSEFLRGATMTKYGVTLFVGIGIPIPVLDADIARATAITDSEILTPLFDYGVPSRSRPVVRQVSYAELKSGSVQIGDEDVPTASISSQKMALRIADHLKAEIEAGRFLLTGPVSPLPTQGTSRPMTQRETRGVPVTLRTRPSIPEGQSVSHSLERCVHCGLCVSLCPAGVFHRDEQGDISCEASLCTECGLCVDACPHRAISVRM